MCRMNSLTSMLQPSPWIRFFHCFVHFTRSLNFSWRRFSFYVVRCNSHCLRAHKTASYLGCHTNVIDLASDEFSHSVGLCRRPSWPNRLLDHGSGQFPFGSSPPGPDATKLCQKHCSVVIKHWFKRASWFCLKELCGPKDKLLNSERCKNFAPRSLTQSVIANCFRRPGQSK